MKKKFLLACLISAVFAAPAGAWELWDQFKATNLTPEGRVVDYSEAKLITTSEGQSYGMFFALVANDKKAFDEMFAWTEKNLGENQPAWLWGIPDGTPNGTGKILDTNNATDSDMWIAYCLIEAARIWNDPSYLPKADGYLAKLKELVRDVPTVGKVILPGRVGFEEKGVITINPSYYPPHILRRFADYDPYWLPVLEGSINAMVRCSPSGVAPDWAKFDAQGRLVDPQKMEGSYNAIRTYLWSGILSPKDQNYEVLMRQYEPMINLVKATNIPPEKVNIGDMTVNNRQVNAFGACFLPYVAADKAGAVIRTVLTTTEMKGDNYYRNVLTVFGLGFDNRAYAFDEKGRLILPTDKMAVKTMTPRNE